ncbi:putative sulfate exporter family transporter [Cryobacterium glaciale]|uniref:Putative sulfate exporter family transporter n=1 Tax=Cryobacterium glaciale TaxID=1259145 RepID=A0A4R8UXI6_9MICO|nr:putative sulfate exporter family transporter [Cryobacterium glaciale]TFB73352.1 putative sulfate exporter family transporter [Cryobacterium glaciale]
MWLRGVLVAAFAATAAWGVHLATPGIPLLTMAVVLGIVVGQIPAARPLLAGSLAPGLSVAAKPFMQLGIVLLGLKLSLVDIAALGWVTIATTVAIVLLTFVGTLGLGRWFGLPGHQPLLIATGFSICGASAIGAMSGVVRARDEETATPIALVTLCGTLAIAVLPLLWHPLGLNALQFGHWVGAGVHDVGQVVATAQIAGSAALAVALVVKLTRVLMLAPIVAAASMVERHRLAGLDKADAVTPATDVRGRPVRRGRSSRPPIIPLFVAGFIAAMLVRTVVPLPEQVLVGADLVQTALLAMALFALGAAVDLVTLLRTGGRALAVGLLSWALIAALAFGAVQLS